MTNDKLKTHVRRGVLGVVELLTIIATGYLCGAILQQALVVELYPTWVVLLAILALLVALSVLTVVARHMLHKRFPKLCGYWCGCID